MEFVPKRATGVLSSDIYVPTPDERRDRCSKWLFHNILSAQMCPTKLPALAPIVLKSNRIGHAGYDSENHSGAISNDWTPGQQILIEVRRQKTEMPDSSNSSGART
jgi:hypothetical protein